MLARIAGSRRRAVSGPINIIADPGFDNAAAWTVGTGWSVSGSKAIAANGGTLRPKSASVVNGTRYRVRFTISGHVPSGASIRLSLGNFQEQIVLLDGGAVRDGEHDIEVVANTQYGSDVVIDGQGFWHGGIDDLDIRPA